MNINQKAEEIVTAVIGDMYALDFKQEQFDEIFNELDSAFPKYQPYYKRGVIRQIITKIFFMTFQDVEVDVIEDRLHLKKSFLEPKKGEIFDRVIHELNLNLMDISENIEQYKPLPYLIVIPSNMREKIFKLLEPYEKRKEPLRYYIRTQISRVLEIKRNDIVLFLRKRIYIRNFSTPRELPDGVDRRFNGATIHEMQELYELYFPDGAWEYIEEYMQEILDKEFNFSQISNREFTSKFIHVFKALIESIVYDLQDETDVEVDELQIDSLANYILRRFFSDILLSCTASLLEYVEKRDKNAEKFIKHFTDEVIIDDKNMKVQKYALIDSDNNSWNYNAIVSTLMQWKQAKARVEKQKSKIENIERNIFEISSDISKIDMNIAKAKERFTKVRSEAIASEAGLRRLESDIKKESSSKVIQELNLKLISLKSMHLKNLDAQKAAEYKRTALINKEENKEIELHSWEKNLKSAKEVMKEVHHLNEKVTKTYFLIAHSIIKVILR
ncbi:MAG: hypothetical protein U9N42_06485 [Campylobacterota bacterium]|nr:hypothetical protein [Campylobacterota bacterium]